VFVEMTLAGEPFGSLRLRAAFAHAASLGTASASGRGAVAIVAGSYR